jgi:hypothetical protein
MDPLWLAQMPQPLISTAQKPRAQQAEQELQQQSHPLPVGELALLGKRPKVALQTVRHGLQLSAITYATISASIGGSPERVDDMAFVANRRRDCLRGSDWIWV